MCFTEYHSSEWELLVETGWATADVYEIDGYRIARMVRR
jgi:hypothetical protein